MAKQPSMTLIADTKALHEAIATAARVAFARSPKPILSCVRLDAAGDELVVDATDLEVSLRQTVRNVEVTQAGALAVSAAMLAQILARITTPTVTLTQQGGKLHIASAASQFNLHTLRADELPAFPAAPADAKAFTMDGAAFADVLRRVMIAHARENSRYAINGVLLATGSSGKFDVVATDGHRLAMEATDIKAAGLNHILPTKAVSMIATQAGAMEDEEVKVAFGDGRVLVEADDWTIASVLVEGNFPPYQDVIPKNGPINVELNREALVESLRSAQVLTNEESKGVRLSLSPDGVTIASRAPELGDASIELEAEVDGDPIEIGFNPAYLLDPLKVMRDTSVRLNLTAANKPGVMRGGAFTYVLMPVNLQ